MSWADEGRLSAGRCHGGCRVFHVATRFLVLRLAATTGGYLIHLDGAYWLPSYDTLSA
jgi:hypothetical protein